MKNKLFWPIVLVSVIIIIESVVLITRNQIKSIPSTMTPATKNITVAKKEEAAVAFAWKIEAGKTVLELKANKDVAIDAIDLYIDYKNTKVNSVANAGELPKPTFSKVSADKSLVVVNYLVSEAAGFKMVAGQSVKVVVLDATSSSSETAQFSINPKTQVVENGTAKVLPYL